jgi:DNA replication protein DnaC
MAHALKEALTKLDPSLAKTTSQPAASELPDLTPEEEQQAILRAREAKYIQQKKAEYWEKVTNETPVKLWTAKELEAKLKVSKNAAGKPYVIDNDNRQIIELVCLYFACDPAFESHSDPFGNAYSLDKGLCLIGNVGTGKTHLMAFFFQNQNQSFTIANCRKIEGRWVEEMSAKEKPQPGVIEFYSTEIKTAVNTNPFKQLALGVCFDDLGTETVPSKAYGEEKHVLAEILMNRYESGIPRNYTHVTTNLSPHEVGLKYGTRVKDRFREMFNAIIFDKDAKSRR